MKRGCSRYPKRFDACTGCYRYELGPCFSNFPHGELSCQAFRKYYLLIQSTNFANKVCHPEKIKTYAHHHEKNEHLVDPKKQRCTVHPVSKNNYTIIKRSGSPKTIRRI
jgi:hypothetical protein